MQVIKWMSTSHKQSPPTMRANGHDDRDVAMVKKLAQVKKEREELKHREDDAMTMLQEKLVKYICIISDDKLATLEPFIEMMADEFAYDIEKVSFDDLDDDEKQAVIEGREEYKKGNYIALDDL